MFTTNRTTDTSAFLHRAIITLIIGNCLLGLVFQIIHDDNMRFVIDTHKSFGLIILALALMHVLWRMSRPATPSSINHARVEIFGVKIGHAALYFSMIALSLSGWMHDSASKDPAAHPMHLFWSIQWPRISMIANLEAVRKEHLHDLFGQIHSIFSYLLYGILALHVADE